MKKLFLTSFGFTTGENEYKEYRLVVVTSADVERVNAKHAKLNGKAGKAPPFKPLDELDVAYDMAKEWFPVMFPESTLSYCIAHEAISGDFFKSAELSHKIFNTTVFTNWYNGKQIPEDVLEDGEPMGHTEDVLIDLDGYRKDFRIGWYEKAENEWKFYDENAKADLSHMKWTCLPIDK